MITEFSTLPKKLYYVQTAEDCTVLDADGDTLAEISAPGGYFPGIGAPDATTGTVTFSPAVKRVIGPFDLAPQLQLTLLGLLGGNDGLPAGYTPLEYLESTGTQYIDTGFLSKDFLEVTIKTSVALLRQTFDFFGSYHSGGLSLQVGAVHSIGDYLTSAFFSSSSLRFSPLELNRFYRIRCSRAGFWVDGQKVGTFESPPEAEILKTADRFLLFARTNFNERTVEYAKMQLKRFEALPLCVMAPALDPTGAPCMYDTVSKTPYYNAGTGDFEYPGKEQEVSAFSLRRPVPFAQLTAHGLRRLYRVPRGYNGTKEEYAAEHGFKPLVETPQPEEGYWAPVWRETTEEIVLDWVETEPPADELETA